ncbi:hypothetical protein [Photobacterium aquimaris]|uniref:Uncharacterized protein n=1 Tax=Photobacterium aquimaris TaxID=512643 RepID=A0A2T3HSL6_9GAMM|nr:hypothetical protein [Photobacterium aquimaris]OBU17512.1 hypothetical protein AYY21_19755 [Photobacterium aquimaris]PQJ36642.1 hypothetical protein BTN98_19935 [Photobacterium aquimaris]PST97361.1 hypothetical protein C0W81_19785 [Photobacterium aquimaris]
MVKKRERITEQQKIDAFARGAEINVITKETTVKREKKFKRVTFSLTEYEDQLIDDLSLTVLSFRCNRSQVVKAALALLAEQDEKTLCSYLKKQNEN